MTASAKSSLDVLKELIALLPRRTAHLPPPELRRVLERLVELAPRTARIPRQLTLFEAINVLNLENPHSDYLAWLLDPAGPLDDCWLLRLLFRRLVGDREWPGTPIVEREVAVSTGRADIVVSWDDFKIVIENKVWSSEGHLQIVRYLEGFEINDTSQGCVVYLTPDGRQPTGVPEDRRDCVQTLSYVDLINIIAEGLAAGLESSQRGHIFANELCWCVQRLLNLRDPMKKPEFSESTSLLITHAKGLQMLMDQAAEETADFIEWMQSQLTERVMPMLGDTAVPERLKPGVLFRLPHWKTTRAIYGIGFRTYQDPRKRLVWQHTYSPWVGVGICMSDGSEETPECQAVMKQLLPALSAAWPYGKEIKSEKSWPLYRYMPIDGSDLDQWHDSIERSLVEMAQKLAPVIDRFANGLRDAVSEPGSRGITDPT